MQVLLRPVFPLFLLAAVVLLSLYASLGLPKALANWQWMDILGEGGSALMAAVWGFMILGSRPAGRVTALLAGGLGAIALGSWADCLDEFFNVPTGQLWDNWLESLLTPGGMLVLTLGLWAWRQEQSTLSEQLHKRERLFREHRAFDRITQLANADYLRRQLELERTRAPQAPCALVLLDLERFHLINRDYGPREGDRVLQAVAHLLLLNLRNQDLLCRYAGDRYAVLLPETDAASARRIAEHLARVVGQLAYHTRERGERLTLSARVASAVADDEPAAVLAALGEALEQPSAGLAA